MGRRGVFHAMKRNQLLFNWASIESAPMMARHALGLSRAVLRGVDLSNPHDSSWGRAFFAALARLPSVLRIRRRPRRAAPVSNRQILKMDSAENSTPP